MASPTRWRSSFLNSIFHRIRNEKLQGEISYALVKNENEDDASPPGSVDDDRDKGEVHLKREVGLFRAVALVVGAMVGSGIFIAPKGILMGTNSVGMSLVIWLACAVVASLGAMCYAELGSVVPRAGGAYQYILHAYGDLAGFMMSWSLTVVLLPTTTAVLSITLGTYISDFVIPGKCSAPEEAVQLFAIVILFIIVFFNCVSLRLTSGLVVVFTCAKVMALGIIIAMGLNKIIQGETQHLDPSVSFKGTSTHLRGYGTAIYNGLWAYGGWEILNVLHEELHRPSRNIPLAIAISIPTVTAIYMMTNIAYFTVLSQEDLLASSAVALTFAERTLGPMAWLIPLGVCISVFGTLLSHILSATRIGFAAGREGHMIKVMSMINIKWLTPVPSVIMQGVAGVICILLGDLNSIIVFSGLVSWFFNGAVFMAVFVLRRRYPNAPRPFKVNAIIPILATLVAVFMFLLPLISEPNLQYLYIFVMLGLGLLVYLVFVWMKRQLPFMDRLNLFCQKLLQVTPSTRPK